MKSLLSTGIAILALAVMLVFYGCGDDSKSANPEPQPEEFGVDTLLTGLEYPSALWVRGDRVYFAETNGRNTGFGGAVAVSVYKLSSHAESLLVNNPTCSDAVVVATDGKIYLGSYTSSIPGEAGSVSVVDPTALVEADVVDLEIAVCDMYIEADNDIVVIGSSDQLTAKSLYRLPVGAYASPVVLKTGLGRVWCVTEQGSDIYYSDQSAIHKVTGAAPVETWYNKSVMSLAASSKYMFYADYFGGTVGMIDFATKTDSTLVSGLHGPHAVRWVDATSRLYFVEVGTQVNEFKDGSLQVVTGIQ